MEPVARRLPGNDSNSATATPSDVLNRHTSDPRAELDHVEAGSTYRAAVGPLDPGLETLVV